MARRHGPDPAGRGRHPGPWEAAGVHGRPLRVVCYASFPLLRSSALRYAPFSHTVKGQEAQQREKGVADAGPPAGGSGRAPSIRGASGRGSAGRRWSLSGCASRLAAALPAGLLRGGPRAGPAPPRGVGGRSPRRGSRAGRRRAVWRDKKGGRRVSFTFGPAPFPSRSGAMTQFPMSAGTAAHPKDTRQPPLPRPRRTRRRPRRCSTRRARRQAPPTHPGAPGRPHPRRHRHRHTAGAPGIGHRGPRARHITREHVPLADVLVGYVTISRVK